MAASIDNSVAGRMEIVAVVRALAVAGSIDRYYRAAPECQVISERPPASRVLSETMGQRNRRCRRHGRG